jgi:hypothetical protein
MIEEELVQRPLTERESEYLSMMNWAFKDGPIEEVREFDLLTNEETIRLVGVEITDYLFVRAIRDALKYTYGNCSIRFDISNSVRQYLNEPDLRQIISFNASQSRRNKITVLLSILKS